MSKKFSKNICTNIQNKKKIIEVIRRYKIETIIHLASFTCVRESKKTKYLQKNNFINQITFLNQIVKLGVKKDYFL